MRNSKQQKPKFTKDDLVRTMAFKFLGPNAFIISDAELENFCSDYVNWRMNPRTNDNYNGDYHYKNDGSFKDDLQAIIAKYDKLVG